MNWMRARLISAQAARMATAASCLLPASSVRARLGERASWKKKAPPAHSALSDTMPGSSSSSESPAAAQPSRPVAAMTSPAVSGAAQGRRDHFAS